MPLSLIVTLLVVLICVWLGFWLVDLLIGTIPPADTPRPFPLGALLKALIVIAALVIIIEAAFGAHRFLIHVSGF